MEEEEIGAEFDNDKVDWIDESIFVYEESDDELQTESCL